MINSDFVNAELWKKDLLEEKHLEKKKKKHLNWFHSFI